MIAPNGLVIEPGDIWQYSQLGFKCWYLVLKKEVLCWKVWSFDRGIRTITFKTNADLYTLIARLPKEELESLKARAKVLGK